jgi:hypothetical protein
MTRGFFCLLLACCALAAPVMNAARAQAALFQPIFEVTQHPRCANCHTDTAAPLQRDGRPHQPAVQRGPEGKGVARLTCAGCHKEQNTAAAPGALDWRMPKAGDAVFRHRPAGDLCRDLRDPRRNGGLQPEALGRHFAEDPLIGWAWSPGTGRGSPALSRDHLVVAVATWLRAGAPCPD